MVRDGLMETGHGRRRGVRRCRGSVTVTAVIVIALMGVAFGVYVMTMRSAADTTAAEDDRVVWSLGLRDRVENRLAERFTDADQDGVADTPAETRDPSVLRLSYLTTDAGVDAAAMEPLRAHLASATGREVEFVALGDSKAQLRALASGELDVTGFNTGTVPVAVNVAGFVPVVGPAREGGESGASYKMVIITPTASGLRSAEDLRGRTLAFSRWGSNSGHKAPMVLLRDEFGMLPERDYSWTFTYSHTNSMAGVAEGRLEAAAVASDLLAAAVAEGAIGSGVYRVIYESAPFPVAAVGYAHDLEPGLAERVRAALLSFVPGETPASKAMAGAVSMTPVDFKDDFALVRMIDNAMGFAHELPAE
ncbi:MAG: phosphate/phosphite/phosphonate ABC transporter substrate-binding protein [Planctomycetota bacterium]